MRGRAIDGKLRHALEPSYGEQQGRGQGSQHCCSQRVAVSAFSGLPVGSQLRLTVELLAKRNPLPEQLAGHARREVGDEALGPRLGPRWRTVDVHGILLAVAAVQKREEERVYLMLQSAAECRPPIRNGKDQVGLDSGVA